MQLSHADVRRVLEILEQSRHLDHIEITLGDYTLKAGKTPADPAPRQVQADETALPQQIEPPAPGPGKPVVSAEIPDGMIAIRAPMAGTFYTTPSPQEPAFVSDGCVVKKGDTLCLVEVMKMFNTIATPDAGVIHHIVAVHGQPVARDAILMIINPGTPE